MSEVTTWWCAFGERGEMEQLKDAVYPLSCVVHAEVKEYSDEEFSPGWSRWGIEVRTDDHPQIVMQVQAFVKGWYAARPKPGEREVRIMGLVFKPVYTMPIGLHNAWSGAENDEYYCEPDGYTILFYTPKGSANGNADHDVITEHIWSDEGESNYRIWTIPNWEDGTETAEAL